MLKITFTLNTPIPFKTSNARAVQIYKRFIFATYLFISHITSNHLHATPISVKLNKHLKSKMLVLMRSPFHYKTSKTLLAQPKQIFKITVFAAFNSKYPFMSSHLFGNLVTALNKSNTFTIKKIKIQHNLC